MKKKTSSLALATFTLVVRETHQGCASRVWLEFVEPSTTQSSLLVHIGVKTPLWFFISNLDRMFYALKFTIIALKSIAFYYQINKYKTIHQLLWKPQSTHYDFQII